MPRGHLDVAATTERIRDEIQHMDDTLPVFGARTLEDTVTASLAARRFSMEIVGLFALIIPGIFLAILWLFAAQAVVIEGTGVRDALRRHLDPKKLSVLKAGDFR